MVEFGKIIFNVMWYIADWDIRRIVIYAAADSEVNWKTIRSLNGQNEMHPTFNCEKYG